MVLREPFGGPGSKISAKSGARQGTFVASGSFYRWCIPEIPINACFDTYSVHIARRPAVGLPLPYCRGAGEPGVAPSDWRSAALRQEATEGDPSRPAVVGGSF